MASWVRGLWTTLALAAATTLAGSGLAETPPAAPKAPAAAAAPAQPSGVQPIPAAELEAFIDGLASDAMARDHIAGAAITVVQNGQVVLQKGYGVDRLGPARAVDPGRTLFRLGGITSTFTWIALMREIEAGHIRLDAPVNVNLPQKNQVRDQGYKRPVLVRELLSHTGGFEERELGQLGERSPARIRPLDVYLRQERPRRVREPGAAPSFSPYGAALAGEALNYVTSQLPQVLLEAQVFRPLGLSRTTLREPYPQRTELPRPMDPALAEDVSQGFRWAGSGFQVTPFEYMTQAAPAVAGSSTAADMGRYLMAILGDGALGGSTIYSPSIARAFRTRTPGAAAGPPGFDHGFMEYAVAGGRKGYGHDGSTLSFRTRLIAVPDLQLGIFVAANTDTAGSFVTETPGKIIQRFYGSPPPLAPTGSDWLKQNAAVFAGDYLTTRRAYHGIEGFVDLLHAGARVRVSDDGVLLTPGPAGVRRWTPEADASLEGPFVRFAAVDNADSLVFELQGGQASRYFSPTGDATFERSGPLSTPGTLAFMAAITAVSGLAAIAGLFLRDRREFRQTSVQGRADAAQISASILWLIAIACFIVWRGGGADAARLMYDWPGPWLLIGSGCAFVAAVMTFFCLMLAPVAWRGGRRLDSWTTGRKARFTFTTVIFTLFAALLVLWGALPPWSR
jgi:CubicO group peptidase (beta-lactamase class C family)